MLRNASLASLLQLISRVVEGPSPVWWTGARGVLPVQADLRDDGDGRDHRIVGRGEDLTAEEAAKLALSRVTVGDRVDVLGDPVLSDVLGLLFANVDFTVMAVRAIVVERDAGTGKGVLSLGQGFVLADSSDVEGSLVGIVSLVVGYDFELMSVLETAVVPRDGRGVARDVEYRNRVGVVLGGLKILVRVEPSAVDGVLQELFVVGQERLVVVAEGTTGKGILPLGTRTPEPPDTGLVEDLAQGQARGHQPSQARDQADSDDGLGRVAGRDAGTLNLGAGDDTCRSNGKVGGGGGEHRFCSN